MKVEVKERKPRELIEKGNLVKADEAIVLVHNTISSRLFAGTAIKGNYFLTSGEYREDFVAKEFVQFHGTITISN